MPCRFWCSMVQASLFLTNARRGARGRVTRCSVYAAQAQRSAAGTPASASSTCSPQPDHVGFWQWSQVTRTHMWIPLPFRLSCPGVSAPVFQPMSLTPRELQLMGLTSRALHLTEAPLAGWQFMLDACHQRFMQITALETEKFAGFLSFKRCFPTDVPLNEVTLS